MSHFVEQIFEKRRRQAKVVSIFLLGAGVVFLLCNGGFLGYAIGKALQQQQSNQADDLTFNNESLLQENVHSNPNNNCEELHSWMTEPDVVGRTGVNVLFAIPQLIGAWKLYMGTQTGKSPTEAIINVNFSHKIQFIFLGTDLIGFVSLSLSIILSGLLEISLCQWIVQIVEMVWSALLCIILVRWGCWFIVDQFRKELNNTIESCGDGKEQVITKKKLILKA